MSSVPAGVREQLAGQTYSWLFVPFLQAVYDRGDQIPGNTIEQTRRVVGGRRWDQMVADTQRRMGGRGEGWSDLVARDPQDPTREHPQGYINAQKQVDELDRLGIRDVLSQIGVDLIQSGAAQRAGFVRPPPEIRPPRPGATATATTTTTTTRTTTTTTGPRPALPPASRPRAAAAAAGAGAAAAAAAGAAAAARPQRGRRAQERRVAADIVRQGRVIAIPELEPASAGQAPPNVHVWPLDGPGSNNFIVLHALDSHTDPAVPFPRNNVVIVNVNMWPPEVYVYDYRLRPLQPRWVTAGGRWLVRRTVALEPQGNAARAYKREFRRWAESAPSATEDGERVRGDVVQTAQAVRPPVQEFVDVYASLQSLLMGGQPIRSILFPASTTHDFPDYIASTGADDDSIIAMSSTLQMSRGASHPWFYDPATSPRAEFQALTTALPLSRDLEQQIAAAQPPLSRRVVDAMHSARPIERPSERSYIVGITYDHNNETVLVWNGRGYVRDPQAPAQQPWTARYDFQSTDLGMRVPYWSSVIDERGDCYYVNAMTLRKTVPLNAAIAAVVEPEERYGSSSSSSLGAPLFTEPFDGSSESGGMCATSVAEARERGARAAERQRAPRQDDELGSNNRLRLNDLHGVGRGPGNDTLILRRKPFNTKTLAYVYNMRTNHVQPLLRKTHFGILGKAYDVPMVRYFPNMRMQTWLRRVRGRPARAPPRESDLQTVQGGYIALARNKLVYVDALNAGTAEAEEGEEEEEVEEGEEQAAAAAGEEGEAAEGEE